MIRRVGLGGKMEYLLQKLAPSDNSLLLPLILENIAFAEMYNEKYLRYIKERKVLLATVIFPQRRLL